MCRTDRQRQKRGLTLIEILLVTAMLSVVALAIYSTFSSGTKIWQKLTRETLSGELNIFFEKLSDDLRNSFKFTGIEFVGKEGSVRFATLIMSQVGDKEKTLNVGEVGYSFDVASNSVRRQQVNYSEVYQSKSVPLRPVLNDVRSLHFQYYYESEDEAYVWSSVWQEEKYGQEQGIPLAVRVKIGFDEDGKRKEITRTIPIPAGGRPLED